MTRRRALLAGVAIAAAAVTTSACRPHPTRTVYLPGVRADLSLTLGYPPGVSSTTACGIGAWLLRVDTANHATWDWTLLFDNSLTHVYGAGGAAQSMSATTGFGLDFRRAVRVEVERLSHDAPVIVAGSSNVDVLCRGIADAYENAGAIAITTPTSVGPQPSPTRAPVAVSVYIDMLRVGASNPVHTDGSIPQLLYPAAASLTSVRDGIGTGATQTDPRGEVLIAGGEATGQVFRKTVWHWSPRNQLLEAEQTGAALSAGRAGLVATTIDDPGAAVLFAGGYGSTPSTNAIDIVRADGIPDASPPTMLGNHAFSSVAYLPRGGHPAVVIAGGVDYLSGSTAQWTSGTASAQIEVLAPPGSDACTTIDPAKVTRCDPGSVALNVNRGLPTAAGFAAADGDRVWFAGGYDPGDVANPPTTVEQLFANLSTSGDFSGVSTFDSYGGDAAVIDSSGVTALDHRPIMAGGLSGTLGPYGNSTRGVATLWTLAANGTTTKLGVTLAKARGLLRVVALRDRALWIGGGIDTGGTPQVQDAVEIYRPGTGSSNGVVLPAAPLFAPRFGFAAVPLQGTRTWLDGAVLVIGGVATEGSNVVTIDDSAPPAELWVPAYACNPDGTPRAQNGSPTQPPVVPLSNPTLPDSCDRARPLTSITDPRTGGNVVVP